MCCAMSWKGDVLLSQDYSRSAADTIATVKNPVDDITALKKVSFVMKEDKVFSKEY